jgi:uncharacterized membrane protein
MAKIEENVEIRRPVDQVFAYVANISNLTRWESAILEVEQTSQGQMGIGTTFRGANKMMGRRMPWTSTITEYEPNKKWSETISSGSSLIEEHLIFSPIEGGTKFTQVFDMKAGGLLKLFTPLMASTMCKQSKGNLSKLKSILESQA